MARYSLVKKWAIIRNLKGLRIGKQDATIQVESNINKCLVTTAFAAAFILISFYIFNLIYTVQPHPYLDEVFHIPQATKYFHGVFQEWDPKITTLPGLYLLSVGVLKPLSCLIGQHFCIVYALRLTNLIACLVNLYLLYRLQVKLDQPKKDLKIFCWNILSAVNMATFPVLYFFTFLYYTDMISVTLILLMYVLHLEEMNNLAAATGFISVVVRQTNVIWVAFFAVQAAGQVVKKDLMAQKKKLSIHLQRNYKYFAIIWYHLEHIRKRGMVTSLQFIFKVLREVCGYLIVCVAFAVFICYNGGIVLGDKTAHEAVIHVPQMLYFSLFSTFFSMPYLFPKFYPYIKYVFRHKRLAFLLSAATCMVIAHTTHAHPYLLADNRHYTFYIWKRIFEKHYLVKYMLIPFYFFGFFSMSRSMKHAKVLFRYSYWLSVIFCLVPHELLEFRYFIIPYLLFRLQFINRYWWQISMEFLINCLVNAATVYLFVTRVFYWEDPTEPQRFLW